MSEKSSDFDELLKRFPSPEARLRLEKDRRDFDIPVNDAIWSFVAVDESYLQRIEAALKAINEAQEKAVVKTKAEIELANKDIDKKIADSDVVLKDIEGNAWRVMGDVLKDASGKIASQAGELIDDTIRTQTHTNFLLSVCAGILIIGSTVAAAIGVADVCLHFHYSKAANVSLPADYATTANTLNTILNFPLWYCLVVAMISAGIVGVFALFGFGVEVLWSKVKRYCRKLVHDSGMSFRD